MILMFECVVFFFLLVHRTRCLALVFRCRKGAQRDERTGEGDAVDRVVYPLVIERFAIWKITNFDREYHKSSINQV